MLSNGGLQEVCSVKRHLPFPSHERTSNLLVLTALSINAEGSAIKVTSAKDHQPRRGLFLSSSEVPMEIPEPQKLGLNGKLRR